MNTSLVMSYAGVFTSLAFSAALYAQEAAPAQESLLGKCVALSSTSDFNRGQDLPGTMYVFFDSTVKKEKGKEVHVAAIASPASVKPSSKLRSFAKKSRWHIDGSALSVTLMGGTYTLNYEFPIAETGDVWNGTFSPADSRRKLTITGVGTPSGGGGTFISGGGGQAAVGSRSSDATMGFIPCEILTILPR